MMNKEVEDALGGRFRIFKREEEYSTLFSLFGTECGPGWVPLLIEFAEAAEVLDVHDVQISQIKEKWHSLRIYFTASGLDQDVLEDIALDIEERSAAICEVCGKHKTINSICDHDLVEIDVIDAWMLQYILEKPVH